tara:strand:+ start:636 stop:1514 length:879 start_codon:yes stop_codon:yes gene_type:complete
MKPSDFKYFKPNSLELALDILKSEENVKIIAGGQSLVPLMNFRLSQPDIILDINDLIDLNFIYENSTNIELGSLFTHTSAINSKKLNHFFPIISFALKYVAHQTIRNQGTIGGSIVNADPSSEWPLLISLLNAKINVANKIKKREILVNDFFESHYVTDLEDDEIVISVTLPKINQYCWAFEEHSTRKGDFAIVEIGVILELEDDCKTIKNARIAIGGVDEKIKRLHKIENKLNGISIYDDLFTYTKLDLFETINPVNDNHGSIHYKNYLSSSLLKKVLKKCVNSRVMLNEK